MAIVGGGPAGAALAIRLAAQGTDVAIFERLSAPRWRACGVFSSPLTRRHLADLGLAPERLAALIRPIRAMAVESTRGPACTFDYGPPEHACGLDRVRLERALLDRAVEFGARVYEGAPVLALALADAAGGRSGASELTVSVEGMAEIVRTRLVVGADGPGSMVARAHGVDRPIRRLRRAGLTAHRLDPQASPEGTAMTARMVIGDGWYCGIAPVPGGRVNIGLVIGERGLRESTRSGATPADILRAHLEKMPGLRAAWQDQPESDPVAVALPLAHRVSQRAGPGFLLVGDACGFVDPLSGDGLHRALASAELAADAILADRGGRLDALPHYDRRMRSRFAPKDLISWILQVFLARPAAMDYVLRRLASRNAIRTTLGNVLADLEDPRHALDPRFIAGLLAP